MPRLYEVDSDADTLIVLTAPKAAFAPWTEVDGGFSTLRGKPAAALSPLNGTSGFRKSTPSINTVDSTTESRFKVSSKHLSLASAHFRNQFKWKWANPEAVQPDGRVHIQLDGFDPTAVTIVLNVIHGRSRRVPKTIDIETLAKIAVFVEKFQFHEAVDVYVDNWLGHLEKSLPEEYSRDLVLWIFVAYVFHRSDLFETATRIAISQSDGPIRTLGLPIKESIIKSIESQRQELVGQALSVVNSALEDLRDGKASCPSGCDSFLLGELIKTLHRRDLAWPQPSRPFIGVGLPSINQAIHEVQSKSWAPQARPWSPTPVSKEATRKRKSPNAYPTPDATPVTSPEPGSLHNRFENHGCTAGDFVNLSPELGALQTGLKGLELESSLGYYLY